MHWPAWSQPWQFPLGVVVEQLNPDEFGAGHSEGVAGAKHDSGAPVVLAVAAQ